ncbi:P-loop containing nucleoside triphosphate hydrolase protein [Pavlovales sp. CCMP2436]|nr:P-loop containing nucleoside triphosphate hydrolase protein [Pavlovales sp. CCMP2436]|mmetsp:Transcript_2924/g.7730  ORF Transcript_2924/g.7730 Transcript_2924/m.7730 type:complete len:519 (+) Transcript_2924:76-1632(+)
MLQQHFGLLSAGARFKRERRPAGSALDAAEMPAEPAKAGLCAPLDFFGETPAPVPPAAKRAKTILRLAVEVDEEEAAEEAPQPQQGPQAAQASSAQLRRDHRIRISEGAPPAVESVEKLLAAKSVRPFLAKNVLAAGYTKFTPVQMQAIPALLAGRDLLACAPTGSGKTAAYCIPLLARLKEPAKKGIRGLIVSPTRELAQQIHRELERLAEGPRFGLCVLAKPAAARGKERPVMWQKYDVLVTTPLRLVHLLQTGSLSLASVALVVLDEADRLLELGFVEQVDEVLAACTHASLQRAMFSATIPHAVDELARSVLREPLTLSIGERNSAAHEIEQKLVYVGREDGKLLAIKAMIQEGLTPPVLIFVQSKERAMELFRYLVFANISVDVIHAERSAAQREAVVNGLRSGHIWVLITTELMARGIDFKGVSLVVNYDMPQTTQSYIHRIGRTGRAGRRGKAVTFFTDADVEFLRPIANVVKASGNPIPDWLLHVKKARQGRKKQLVRKPVARKGITSTN